MRHWQYILFFMLFWFVTITLFIWIVNLNLLSYILVTPALTGNGKLRFVADAYANYFRYIINPIAFTSIVFSILVALNFTLLVFLWKEAGRRANLAKQNSGAFVAMLGAHCLSCGTSFVAPLLSAFVGSSAYLSTGRANASLVFATAANVVGIILIIWSLFKVIEQINGKPVITLNNAVSV